MSIPRAAAALLALALLGAGALGWWRDVRERRAARESEVRAQLAALGYVPGVTDEVDASRSGVVLHDPARASPGVNVYCSVRGDRVRFLDMEGRSLHTLALDDPGEGADCMVEPYGERGFLVVTWPSLTLHDFDSRVVWKSVEGQHHDVSADAAGHLWTLLQQEAELRVGQRTLPIVESILARQGAAGELELQIPLSRLFSRFVPEERLARLEELVKRGAQASPEFADASDLFHFNTVEVLDRDLAVGRRGQLLLCARELDLVAVVDPAAPAIVWSWGPGELDRPHHPSVLPNGNLLIFDNGNRRGWSRLVELEPASGKIVWEYRGEPPESFSSPVRGAAQPLPNGNVLVTESTRGRVFEVTRGGEIVWSFLNPDFEQGSRRQIYRMLRVAPERFATWAAPPKETDGDGVE